MGQLPARWERGTDVTVRLRAFNVVPLSRHRLGIVCPARSPVASPYAQAFFR
jgi:hypothetical protein